MTLDTFNFFREPVVDSRDLVTARGKRRESKAAAAIGSRLAVGAGVGIGDRDRGAIDGFTGHLRDASPDFSGAALRVCRRTAEESDKKEQGSGHSDSTTPRFFATGESGAINGAPIRGVASGRAVIGRACTM